MKNENRDRQAEPPYRIVNGMKVKIKVLQKIEFSRIRSGEKETCLIRLYCDSACIEEPDGMTIVEECHDPLSSAIAYVESKGYVRCKKSALGGYSNIKIEHHFTDERIEGHKDVVFIEDFLKGKLPEDYLQFLVATNGGEPKPNCFSYVDQSGRKEDSLVDRFFGVSDNESYGFQDNIECYEDRIPLGFCPIADDPFDNLILLGVHDLNRGQVYFWDHEEESEDKPTMDNMSFIAPAFTEFIKMLEEFPSLT